MPLKNKIKRKKYHKKYHKIYYKRRKKYFTDKRAFTKLRNKNFIINLKKNSKCIDCGISDYRVLDFDHLPSFKKIATIATGVVNSWSLKRIKEEIKKCEIRCSNCHRIKTLERRLSSTLS